METYKGRIFVETEYSGANVSCISTEKGLVLIDSPFLPEDARHWVKTVVERTGRDIAFQINTDHHFDHVMGNGFVTDRIICHDKAAKGIKFIQNKNELKNIIQSTLPDEVKAFEAEMDNLVIPSPLITFDRTLTLDLGDATFFLEYVGGHSPGTILTYLKEDKVLFTGDNVEVQFPFFVEGRFYRWKEVLQKIRSMDIDLVVPGHGPVGGMEIVDTYIDFFEKLEAEVKTFDRQGVAMDQMAPKSKIFDYFSVEEEDSEELTDTRLAAQYTFAAQQILAGS